MESVLIWFATGFSFVCGMFVASWCIRKAGSGDKDTIKLMQERNALDAKKIEVFERMAEIMQRNSV